jgi:hypothetical protein
MSPEPSVKAREIPRQLLVSRATATEAAEQQCAVGSIAEPRWTRAQQIVLPASRQEERARHGRQAMKPCLC